MLSSSAFKFNSRPYDVGDNVGDVAGMGSDLFGSFAEATCAALVIAAQSRDLVGAGWDTLVGRCRLTPGFRR